jgi:hypothetical protein
MMSRFEVAFLSLTHNWLTCLQTLFLESYVDDQLILEENARSVKISSPDVSCIVHLIRSLLLTSNSSRECILMMPLGYI